MINALSYGIQRMTAVLGDFGIIGTPGNQPAGNVTPGEVASQVAGNVPADAPAPVGGMGAWTMILIWGGVILVMYLLMFRPQRKREKKLKEMQAAISVGDNVITNAGLFGRIADVGEDCFIIEFGTNRNIRIPILKSEIVGIRSPKMTPQIIDAPAGKE
ncbi:MAG: preprotein translocase subunit YajC [Defluviitaleaceae bacterium]|nr:preprotein translocase subunit YajC [Defluviitaleaceae bacterium]